MSMHLNELINKNLAAATVLLRNEEPIEIKTTGEDS